MSPNSTLLVIGHSFIRRLRDFLAHSRTNGNAFGADLDLRDDLTTVIFHGVGGMTLDQLRAETDLIKDAVQAHSHFTITFCYKQLCGRCLVHMTPVVKVVIHCVFALL